jgi:hypothetical protein
MYRFNSQGFIVEHFKNMEFNDSELGDEWCQMLHGPTWAAEYVAFPAHGFFL